MLRLVSAFVAAALSLLVISTSASGAVCDLSCWLHQTQADCHTVSSAATGNEMAMSMPSDMDMGPGMNMGTDESGSMSRSGTVMATSGHSMSMPVHMQMVTERLAYATEYEIAAGGAFGHSKRSSSCLHEPCAQVGTSASPPSPQHSQSSGSLHWIAISVTNPANSGIGSHWIRPGTPPPRILAVAPLTTTLRI